MLNIDQMIDEAKRRVKNAISLSVAKHMHQYFKGQMPYGVLTAVLETSPPPVVYVCSRLLAEPRHRLDKPLPRTLCIRCTVEYAYTHFYDRVPTIGLERLFVTGDWWIESVKPVAYAYRCVDVTLYRVY